MSDAVLPPSERPGAIERWYDEFAVREELEWLETVDAAGFKVGVKGENAVVVDCRDADERETSVVVMGAMTSAEVLACSPDEREQLLRGKKVFAHCPIGARSGKFLRQVKKEAEEAGYVEPYDLVNFKGSVLAWCHSGEPMLDSKGNPTTKVHALTEMWANLMPDDGREIILRSPP